MNWILYVCFSSCTLGMPDNHFYFSNKVDCTEQIQTLKDQGAAFAWCVPTSPARKGE